MQGPTCSCYVLSMELKEFDAEEWRRDMEDRGLNINRKKTVYLRFNVGRNLEGNSDINLQGHNLEERIHLNT